MKFLTEDFCNLINLKHLDLYNNQLENLPVQFGKLSKLRYLDLKGNPLGASLQKVIGPCLTLKDCQNAAKNIVPFMVELNEKLLIEQRRKEEEELKRKDEELKELKEQIRLAKKAARKERKKLVKAQEELNQEENGEIKSEKFNIPSSTTCSSGCPMIKISGFLLFSIFIIFAILFAFPSFLSNLPPKYESMLKQFLN